MTTLEEKKKGVYKNLISGGISASFARTITNPLERVEILRQVENVDYKGLNMVKSMIKIYETQGVTGLYKGNTASVVRVFPFSALEFYFIEFYKNLLIRGNVNRQISFLYTFVCGGLTGLTAATFTFPLDVARTRLAATTINSNLKENRISTSLINLWKSGGLRGLYKGYSVASVGTIFFIAIKQTIFDTFKIKYINNSQNKQLCNFIFGSLAGTLGTCIMYPTYLVKRVLQANSKILNTIIYLDDKNFRLLNYLKNHYSKYGFGGFYLGFTMTLLKTAPYIGITFWCNEKLKEMFCY